MEIFALSLFAFLYILLSVCSGYPEPRNEEHNAHDLPPIEFKEQMKVTVHGDNAFDITTSRAEAHPDVYDLRIEWSTRADVPRAAGSYHYLPDVLPETLRHEVLYWKSQGYVGEKLIRLLDRRGRLKFGRSLVNANAFMRGAPIYHFLEARGFLPLFERAQRFSDGKTYRSIVRPAEWLCASVLHGGGLSWQEYAGMPRQPKRAFFRTMVPGFANFTYRTHKDTPGVDRTEAGIRHTILIRYESVLPHAMLSSAIQARRLEIENKYQSPPSFLQRVTISLFLQNQAWLKEKEILDLQQVESLFTLYDELQQVWFITVFLQFIQSIQLAKPH